MNRLGEIALRVEMGVNPPEILLDLSRVQVHGRGDDVARQLVAELDDVLAEVGLDRHDARALEMAVEADLLGDHRLAFGDRPGAGRAADGRG